MRIVGVLLTASLMLGIGVSWASLDHRGAGAPTVEVVVFEHPDSISCRQFRNDVLPKYDQAMRTAAPLRFVDVAIDGTASLGLNKPIEVVPTVAVMRDGREIDRIVGYWGSTNFFVLLSHILARMGDPPG